MLAIKWPTQYFDGLFHEKSQQLPEFITLKWKWRWRILHLCTYDFIKFAKNTKFSVRVCRPKAWDIQFHINGCLTKVILEDNTRNTLWMCTWSSKEHGGANNSVSQ